jgi:murein L,D-transpeptidase YcbB/YkuD
LSQAQADWIFGSRPGARDRTRRWIAALVGLVVLGLVVLAAARIVVFTSDRPVRQLQAALQAEAESGRLPADVVRFYEIHSYQPLWVQTSRGPLLQTRLALRPEARRVAALAAGDPAGSHAAQMIAQAGRNDPTALARAEVATSLALGSYVRGLARPGPEPMAFVDPALAPPADTGAVLDQAAPSVARYVAAVGQVNPIYRDLLTGLSQYRRTWSALPQTQIPAGPALHPGERGARVYALRVRLGLMAGGAPFDGALSQAVRRFQQVHGLPITGEGDAATVQALNLGATHYEQLIQLNLRRAQALPPVLGRRLVVVNPAARQLWAYEDGQARHSMRVVVGAPQEQTPQMIGMLRYLVANPYWNIPVDMVRTSVAPRVLKDGPGYLKAAHLQILSDWGDMPVAVDPRQVDWNGVAQGWQELRMRQAPGGDNMMGRMKFMLPNPLGIYLHDTPNKGAFKDGPRLLSAGCVRLENPDALAEWLLGGALPDIARMPADQEADLPEPTPVYITYMTAAPTPSGVTFFPDVYGKDRALTATAHP